MTYEDLGFKLKIQRDELESRLLKRAAHHRAREKFYMDESKKFANDREVIDQPHSNRRMGTHQEELERSAKIHGDQAKYLEFVAEHLPKGDPVLDLTGPAISSLELLE